MLIPSSVYVCFCVYLCLHAVCDDVRLYASTDDVCQILLMEKKGVDDGKRLLAGFVYGKRVLNLITQ